MKIIYNPKDGAPITSFIYQGTMLDPHYPDGYQVEGKIMNGLVQYDDFTAQALLETYEFLKELTVEQAQARLDEPEDPQFACDFPGCDFKTTAKIALAGHAKKHKKDIEEANTPVLPTSVIPVAGGKKVAQRPLAEKEKMVNNKDIPNGTDTDGVEWYGEGETIENNSSSSFNKVRPEGKGHFVG